MDDLSLEEAAVELGVSPAVVTQLLTGGQLPSHQGGDGQGLRVLRDDLATHRDRRFAFRQQLVQEQRDRRWPLPETQDDLTD